jgi:hypothetical protein
MSTYINERSNPIKIPQKSTSLNSPTNNEHALNYMFNDPSKMTPPNYFMDKLIMRMENYYDSSSYDSKKNFNFKMT